MRSLLFVTISVLSLSILDAAADELAPSWTDDHEQSNKSAPASNSALQESVIKRKKGMNIDLLLEPQKKVMTPLKDIVADSVHVSISDKTMSLQPFTGIGITVTNNSDRTIEVNGDACSATIGGTTEKCLTMAQIESSIDLPDSPRHKYRKQLAASLEGAAFVGATLAARDQVNQKRAVKERYGWDERRREEQSRRFSKRVLYPGDTTSGFIYFDTWLNGEMTISIPVTDFNNDKDAAALSAKKAFESVLQD